MKRLIITFLFITHSLFGQSNFQTSINKNGLLSIEPKNHVDPEQLNQNLINGNSSSVFWVEPRIRDNYEPPALPILKDPIMIGVERCLGGKKGIAGKGHVIIME